MRFEISVLWFAVICGVMIVVGMFAGVEATNTYDNAESTWILISDNDGPKYHVKDYIYIGSSEDMDYLRKNIACDILEEN